MTAATPSQDRPGISLSLPGGDSAFVALQGAQPLSWIAADGVERFYLSPRAAQDGHSAIRGGTPVCFPQFNQRGPLPKHGFARNLAWTPVPDASGIGLAVLELRDSDATRALWPHAFRARLGIALAPGSLRIDFSVENTGGEPFDFALALHSYLRVGDIAGVRLQGLADAPWWDAVQDRRHPPGSCPQPEDGMAIDGETDRVYTRSPPAAALHLHEPRGVLAIAQSGNLTETVVWNPGEALCATLADMPSDGWRHMLCVEAARIDLPVRLLPGATWSAWQQLTAMPS